MATIGFSRSSPLILLSQLKNKGFEGYDRIIVYTDLVIDNDGNASAIMASNFNGREDSTNATRTTISLREEGIVGADMTIKLMNVYIVTNTNSGDTEFYLYKNEANVSSNEIIVSAGLTGEFEDSTEVTYSKFDRIALGSDKNTTTGIGTGTGSTWTICLNYD